MFGTSFMVKYVNDCERIAYLTHVRLSHEDHLYPTSVKAIVEEVTIVSSYKHHRKFYSRRSILNIVPNLLNPNLHSNNSLVLTLVFYVIIQGMATATPMDVDPPSAIAGTSSAKGEKKRFEVKKVFIVDVSNKLVLGISYNYLKNLSLFIF